MIDINNIVTVDIALEKPKYILNYQVLIDMPLEKVLSTATENEVHNIFTFPFYTGTVEEVPDFSSVVGYNLYHLRKPFYVGNCENTSKAIQEILRVYLKDYKTKEINK